MGSEMPQKQDAALNVKRTGTTGWLNEFIICFGITGLITAAYRFMKRNQERDINQLEDVKMDVTEDIEREIVDGFAKMLENLDLAGIRRVYEYTKSLSLSEETSKHLDDIIAALDDGNIKVANQLANHSRT